MKYYIAPKDAVLAHIRTRNVRECHYIDLPEGNVLVKATFEHDHASKAFESHPQIISLPHVLSGRKVGAKVAAALKHLGVEETHSTFDVAEAAEKIMPTMGHK